MARATSFLAGQSGRRKQAAQNHFPTRVRQAVRVAWKSEVGGGGNGNETTMPKAAASNRRSLSEFFSYRVRGDEISKSVWF